MSTTLFQKRRPSSISTAARRKSMAVDAASPQAQTSPRNFIRMQSLEEIDHPIFGRTGIVSTVLQWFTIRIAAVFRVPQPSVTMWLEQDDPIRALNDFLTDAGRRRILVQWNPGATQLVVTSSLQSCGSRNSGKVMYFLKLRNFRVDGMNVEGLLTGDISDGVLDHLSIVGNEIYAPIISNPQNITIADGSARELGTVFHKFLSQLYVTLGQSYGKTLLPMPPREISLALPTGNHGRVGGKDKERLYFLEMCVVGWTKQIRQVLKHDSVSFFEGEDHALGTSSEFDYWQNRAENLSSLLEQLSNEKMKKVIKIMEAAKSSHFYPYCRLIREVNTLSLEADDIVLHLAPLKELLAEHFPPESFADVVKSFNPAMHMLLMVWKTSSAFNTSARLQVFLEKMCNDIVRAGNAYLHGFDPFGNPAKVVEETMRVCLRVCAAFKGINYDYRRMSEKECPKNPWRLQDNVFAPLDSFLERCHDLMDLAQVIDQMQALEKVELGTSKGKRLTLLMRQISTEFAAAVQKIKNVNYDITDISAKEFDDDFYDFRRVVRELEHRLAQIIAEALDASITLSSALGVITIFQAVIKRKIIEQDLQSRFANIPLQVKEELRSIAERFNLAASAFRKGSVEDTVQIALNMPPQSGYVFWIHSLQSRASEPVLLLQRLLPELMIQEDGREVLKMLEALENNIAKFETQIKEQWLSSLDSRVQDRLRQPLLLRNEASGLLSMNFDPDLVRVLRETKYFSQIGLDAPDVVMAVCSKAETFRQYTGNAEMVANICNEMRQQLLPVEVGLMQSKFVQLDEALEEGLRHLNWKSHSIPAFLKKTMALAKEAHGVMRVIKANSKQAIELANSWSLSGIFDRGFQRTLAVTEFTDQHQTDLQSRMLEVRDDSDKIHRLVAEILEAVQLSRGEPAWKDFVDSMNERLLDALLNSVMSSLVSIRDLLDPVIITARNYSPALEIRLELIAPKIVFHPELRESARDTAVLDMVRSWIQDSIQVSKSLRMIEGGGDGGLTNVSTKKRTLSSSDGWASASLASESIFDAGIVGGGGVQTVSATTFLDLVNAETEIVEMKTEIEQLAMEVLSDCEEFSKSYQEFSHLWNRDPSSAFAEFLSELSGQGLSASDELDEYRGALVDLKSVEEKVKKLPNTSNFSWLRIDGKPIKQALYTWLSKWTFVYTDHLVTALTKNLSELNDFVKNCEDTLGSVVEGSQDAIVEEVMFLLYQIKERSINAEEQFEELVDIHKLLKSFNVELPAWVATSVSKLPQRWAVTCGLAAQSRSVLEDVIEHQTKRLRAKVNEFLAVTVRFRQEYLSGMPLNANASLKDPYDIIDTFYFGPEVVAQRLRSKPSSDLAEDGSSAALLRASIYVAPRNSLPVPRMQSSKKKAGTGASPSGRSAAGSRVSTSRVGTDVSTIESAALAPNPPSQKVVNQSGRLCIRDLLDRAAVLNDLEPLYDLNPTKFPDLQLCAEEAGIVKRLWDLMGLAGTFFESVERKPWRSVDMGVLVSRAEELSGLSKRTIQLAPRNWPIRSILETTTRNISSMIQLIRLFQDPAIRDRHWKQLSRETGVNIDTDREPLMGEMIALELYRYSDEVNDIISRAKKEAEIELILLDTDSMWKNLNLEFDLPPSVSNLSNGASGRSSPDSDASSPSRRISLQFLADSSTIKRRGSNPMPIDVNLLRRATIAISNSPRNANTPNQLQQFTDSFSVQIICPAIRAPTHILAALDETMVRMQNLQSNQYVISNPVFRSEVVRWQHRLTVVEVTLDRWTQTQSKFSALSSMLSTPSLRGQLPSAVQDFERMAFTWKKLMLEASFSPNAVEACNVDGRLTTIEILLQGFESVEAMLNSHLDELRMKFPRLYLLSSSDLMLMLSSRGKPAQAQRAIINIFSGLRSLTFDAELKATSFHGPKGEVMPLYPPLDCSGSPETWVENLVGAQLEAVQYGLYPALRACLGSTPGSAWFLEHSMQLSLVVARIEATQVTEKALSGLSGASIKAELQKAIDATEIELKSRADMLRSSISPSESRKSAALIMVAVEWRDLQQKLLDNSTDENEFDWVMHPKYFAQLPTEGLRQPMKKMTIALELDDSFLSSPRESASVDSQGREVPNTDSGKAESVHSEIPRNRDIGIAVATVLKIGGEEIPYGFEYRGDDVYPFIPTGASSRLHHALAFSLRGGSACGVLGAPDCGRTESIRAFSYLCGKLSVELQTAGKRDGELIDHVIAGVFSSGAYLLIHVTSTSVDSVFASRLASSMLQLQAAVRSNSDYLSVGCVSNVTQGFDNDRCLVALKAPTGWPPHTSVSSVPPALRAVLRPYCIASPDLKIISVALLAKIGLQKAEELGRKVVILQRLATLSLGESPQGPNLTGLSIIRAIAKVAKSRRAADTLESEATSVANACVAICAQRLIGLERIMYQRLVCSVFGSAADGLNGTLEVLDDFIVEPLPKSILGQKGKEAGRGGVILPAVPSTPNTPSLGKSGVSRGRSFQQRKKSDTLESLAQIPPEPSAIDVARTLPSPLVSSKFSSDFFHEDSYLLSAAQKLGLKVTPSWASQVLNLLSCLDSNRGVFLVGRAGSGKSGMWRCAAAFLSASGEQISFRIVFPRAAGSAGLWPKKSDDGIQSGPVNHIATSGSAPQMAGANGDSTPGINGKATSLPTHSKRADKDGLLAAVLKDLATPAFVPTPADVRKTRSESTPGSVSPGSKSDHDKWPSVEPQPVRQVTAVAATAISKWLIFDGEVESSWTDGLSGALDAKAIVQFSSMERMYLPSSSRILLETSDLRHASPSLLCKGSLIHVRDDDVTWEMIISVWLHDRREFPGAAALRRLMLPEGSFGSSSTLGNIINYLQKCAPSALPAAISIHHMCSLLDALIFRLPEDWVPSSTDDSSSRFPKSTSDEGLPSPGQVMNPASPARNLVVDEVGSRQKKSVESVEDKFFAKDLPSRTVTITLKPSRTLIANTPSGKISTPSSQMHRLPSLSQFPTPPTSAAPTPTANHPLHSRIPTRGISFFEAAQDGNTLNVHYHRTIEGHFFFAAIWSLAGHLPQREKTEFGKWLRTMFPSSNKPPSPGTVFDSYFDGVKWLPWHRYSASPTSPHHQGASPRATSSPHHLGMAPGVPGSGEIVDGMSVSLYGMMVTADMAAAHKIGDLYMSQRIPMLLIGPPGSGKSRILENQIAMLDPEYTMSYKLSLHVYSSSAILQRFLENALERKSGRLYSPAGTKRMTIVVEDLHLPQRLSESRSWSGTATPLELIRQLIDCKFWFDQCEHTERAVEGVSFLGSFTPCADEAFALDLRLRRHFASLSIEHPSRDAMCTVFKAVASRVLEVFEAPLQELAISLARATVDVLIDVADTFVPCQGKEHYVWSQHQVARVFEGLSTISNDDVPTAAVLVRRWVFDMERAFADRLCSSGDARLFGDILAYRCRAHFESHATDALASQQLFFLSDECLFGVLKEEAELAKKQEERAQGVGVGLPASLQGKIPVKPGSKPRPVSATTPHELSLSDGFGVLFADALYANAAKGNSGNESKVNGDLEDDDDAAFAEDVPSFVALANRAELRDVIERRVRSFFNETGPRVLFDDMLHKTMAAVYALSRPDTHLTLIGPPGSSKETTVQLAAAILGMQLQRFGVPTKGANGLLTALRKAVWTASVENSKVTFFVSDYNIELDSSDFSQSKTTTYGFLSHLITCTSYAPLVYVFGPQEQEELHSFFRQLAAKDGLTDTPDNVWRLFYTRVRSNLHVALSLSNTASTQTLLREFPIFSKCPMLWYLHWSGEVVQQVSATVLSSSTSTAVSRVEQVTGLDRVLSIETLANHIHSALQTASSNSSLVPYLVRVASPVCPCVSIAIAETFLSVFEQRNQVVSDRKLLLSQGLERLNIVISKMGDLEGTVATESQIVQQRKNASAALLAQVGQETAALEQQQQQVRAAEALLEQARAAKDELDEQVAQRKEIAGPYLNAVQLALRSLDKDMIAELRSMPAPPEPVIAVAGAAMILVTPKNKVVPVDTSWAACKRIMNQADKFLLLLQQLNLQDLNGTAVERVEQDYMCKSYFMPEVVGISSSCAAGICDWVVNVVRYHRAYEDLKPREFKLRKATQLFDTENQRVAALVKRQKELDVHLADLTSQFQHATEEKNLAANRQAETIRKVKIARVIMAELVQEKKNWMEAEKLVERMWNSVPGDAMLAATLVCLGGALSHEQRLIFQRTCETDLFSRRIPTFAGMRIGEILMTKVQMCSLVTVAEDISPAAIESLVISAKSQRWPYIADPKGIFVSWLEIADRFGLGEVIRVKQSQPNFMETVVAAMNHNRTLVIQLQLEEPTAITRSLLNERIFDPASAPRKMLLANGKEVDLHSSWRMFVVSQLNCPTIAPFLQPRCNVISLSDCPETLCDRLLAAVIKIDLPVLQRERVILVKQIAEDRLMLSTLEEDLLKQLRDAPVDIFSQLGIVDTLEINKKQVSVVEQRLLKAKKKAIGIQSITMSMKSLALRFKLLLDLSRRMWAMGPNARTEVAVLFPLIENAITKTSRVSIGYLSADSREIYERFFDPYDSEREDASPLVEPNAGGSPLPLRSVLADTAGFALPDGNFAFDDLVDSVDGPPLFNEFRRTSSLKKERAGTTELLQQQEDLPTLLTQLYRLAVHPMSLIQQISSSSPRNLILDTPSSALKKVCTELESRAERYVDAVTAATLGLIFSAVPESQRIASGLMLASMIFVQRGVHSADEVSDIISTMKPPEHRSKPIVTSGVEIESAFQRFESHKDVNPCPSWLPDDCWLRILSLAKECPNSSALASVADSVAGLKDWYASRVPEERPLPRTLEHLLSPLERLALIQAVRPDRVPSYARRLVESALGKWCAPLCFGPFDPTFGLSIATAEHPLLLIFPNGDISSLPNFLPRPFENRVILLPSPVVNPTAASEAMMSARTSGHVAVLADADGCIDWMQKCLADLEAADDDVLRQIPLPSFSSGRGDSSGLQIRNVNVVVEEENEDDEGGSATTNNEALTANFASLGVKIDGFQIVVCVTDAALVPPSLSERCVRVVVEPASDLRQATLHSLATCAEIFAEEQIESTKQFQDLLLPLSLVHGLVTSSHQRSAGTKSRQGWYTGDEALSDIAVEFTRVANGKKFTSSSVSGRKMLREIMRCHGFSGAIDDGLDARLVDVYFEALLSKDSVYSPFNPIKGAITAGAVDGVTSLLSLVEQNWDEVEGERALDVFVCASGVDEESMDTGSLVYTMSSSALSKPELRGMTRQDRAKLTLDDLLEKVPENVTAPPLSKMPPNSALGLALALEVEILNNSLDMVRKSLLTLDAELQGRQPLTASSEELVNLLCDRLVPRQWVLKSHFRQKCLGTWLKNLVERANRLLAWVQVFPSYPGHISLSHLSRPQALLSAVIQTEAMANGWDVSRTIMVPEMTHKTAATTRNSPSKDGLLISGLHLVGARWDAERSTLAEAANARSPSQLPLVFLRCVQSDDRDPTTIFSLPEVSQSTFQRGMFNCPVYATEKRDAESFVCTIPLKSYEPEAAWIASGTMIFLERTDN